MHVVRKLSGEGEGELRSRARSERSQAGSSSLASPLLLARALGKGAGYRQPPGKRSTAAAAAARHTLVPLRRLISSTRIRHLGPRPSPSAALEPTSRLARHVVRPRYRPTARRRPTPTAEGRPSSAAQARQRRLGRPPGSSRTSPARQARVARSDASQRLEKARLPHSTSRCVRPVSLFPSSVLVAPFSPELGSSCSLDRILSHPTLTLRDHLALAATCRPLRACYWTAPGTSTPDNPPSSPLWAGLVALRRGPVDGKEVAAGLCSTRERRAVMRIYSRGVKVDAESFEVVGAERAFAGGDSSRKRAAASTWQGETIRSAEWERAILLVHSTVRSDGPPSSSPALREPS